MNMSRIKSADMANILGCAMQIKRDKNHPSIIVWSCGNESGFGKAHTDMAKFYRQLDPSRPTHYEVRPYAFALSMLVPAVLTCCS